MPTAAVVLAVVTVALTGVTGGAAAVAVAVAGGNALQAVIASRQGSFLLCVGRVLVSFPCTRGQDLAVAVGRWPLLRALPRRCGPHAVFML